jgi:hypothetical protein
MRDDDPSWEPNPILPDPLHNDRTTKIPSVKNSPDHIGESVWRSSMKGGEPNPE